MKTRIGIYNPTSSKMKVYVARKFSFGDTIKSSHMFTRNIAYFISMMRGNGVFWDMKYWISPDTKYIGFREKIGDKFQSGWIKLIISDYTSINLISYKISMNGDILNIDK